MSDSYSKMMEFRESFERKSKSPTEVLFSPEEAEKLRVVEKIDLARLRELATADKEGRVVVLNTIFETPRGEFGFIYYTKDGLLMGTFHQTQAEAARALADADAGNTTEPKG